MSKTFASKGWMQTKKEMILTNAVHPNWRAKRKALNKNKSTQNAVELLCARWLTLGDEQVNAINGQLTTTTSVWTWWRSSQTLAYINTNLNTHTQQIQANISTQISLAHRSSLFALSFSVLSFKRCALCTLSARCGSVALPLTASVELEASLATSAFATVTKAQQQQQISLLMIVTIYVQIYITDNKIYRNFVTQYLSSKTMRKLRRI